MGAMTQPDRTGVGAGFQTDVSQAREQFGALTKADIQAAVTAVDTWCDTNTASFNSAIPLPARTALTAAQKTRLLVYVIKRRFETGV